MKSYSEDAWMDAWIKRARHPEQMAALRDKIKRERALARRDKDALISFVLFLIICFGLCTISYRQSAKVQRDLQQYMNEKPTPTPESVITI